MAKRKLHPALQANVDKMKAGQIKRKSKGRSMTKKTTNKKKGR